MGKSKLLKKIKKVKLSAVMSLIYDCLAAKIVNDSKDDQACKAAQSMLVAKYRRPLPDFIKGMPYCGFKCGMCV